MRFRRGRTLSWRSLTKDHVDWAAEAYGLDGDEGERSHSDHERVAGVASETALSRDEAIGPDPRSERPRSVGAAASYEKRRR
jgi:hypothetical protein